jgi:hypothetical protein
MSKYHIGASTAKPLATVIFSIIARELAAEAPTCKNLVITHRHDVDKTEYLGRLC